MQGKQEIQDLLRECRERAGFTQEQLANRIYVDRTIITKAETGKINPSYVLVKQWALATNSVDLINIDLGGSGSGNGWKKLRQQESILKAFKSQLDSISLLKLARKGGKQVGSSRTSTR